MGMQKWFFFIKPKVVANEEAKALIGVGVVLVFLTGLNLSLYISNGVFLKLTIPLGLATIVGLTEEEFDSRFKAVMINLILHEEIIAK